MFNWFRRADPPPFDPAWRQTLTEGVWHYRFLSEEKRERLHQVVAQLAARMQWIGGADFEVTEQMRVVVSGVAAILTLGYDEPYFFPKLKSIILYPSAFQQDESSFDGGFLGTPDPIMGGSPRLGEAWQYSPVILSWRSAQRQARVPGRGHNVILHEMAHHVDGLDGEMDGAPQFASRALHDRWNAVVDREYHQLLGQAWRREETLLDTYGATNRTEFFAVSTECFFERPHELQARHTELYELLVEFYQQSPAQWIPRPEADSRQSSESRKRKPQSERLTFAQRASLDHLQLNETDTLFSKGLLMMQDEHFAEARSLFSQVLQRTPDDSEALIERGWARSRLDDHRGARDDAEAALALEPDDISALLLLADTSLALNDEASAASAIKQILWEDRLQWFAWQLKGRLHARQLDDTRAIKAFRRALGNNNLDAQTHYRLAECLERKAQLDMAGWHRRRALHLDPSLEHDPPKP